MRGLARRSGGLMYGAFTRSQRTQWAKDLKEVGNGRMLRHHHTTKNNSDSHACASEHPAFLCGRFLLGSVVCDANSALLRIGLLSTVKVRGESPHRWWMAFAKGKRAKQREEKIEAILKLHLHFVGT
jgi:hypothetical protein